ncbi:hypothetical protein CSAL01_00452 [Colletotrichum salicis]|uniref:Uncharacterized protein n=1 Tax=Colletotrichum salicis TaxID=1209931 RepID=A0A135SD22_9PEZI|nr:hypothetical protein CSAL01_00452 [Colletotrichum salicis]
MAGNSWTAEAEKALLLSIATTANAGAGTKPEWAAVTRRMNRLGYNFTSAALATVHSQRYGKSLAKPYNDRINAAADVPITPASTPSRKRAAPGSGTRATRTSAAGGSGPAQAANEMASLALSADNGGDDAEPDMEDSKKRVKFTHGSASAGLDAGLNAGLNGQQIDLTGDDTGVNIENTAPAAGENGQPIDLADDQVEIKHEVEIRFLNASFSHRARARSMTLNPIPTNEEYFEVKIEKDVLAACEAGRKQLQEINAKKVADKEKARKTAEEKAAANATAMDLD